LRTPLYALTSQRTHLRHAHHFHMHTLRSFLVGASWLFSRLKHRTHIAFLLPSIAFAKSKSGSSQCNRGQRRAYRLQGGALIRPIN
jgi:hypothetical protein